MRDRAGRVLDTNADGKIGLRMPSGLLTTVSAMRLVWRVYRGPLARNRYVRPRDGDATRAALRNLYLGTPKQNWYYPEVEGGTTVSIHDGELNDT